MKRLHLLCFGALAAFALLAVCTSPIENEIMDNHTAMQELFVNSNQKFNVAWSPDSSMLAYEVPFNSTTILQKGLSGQVLDTLVRFSAPLENGGKYARLSRNGEKLLYQVAGNTFKILTLSNRNSQTFDIPEVKDAYGLDWAPDNQHLYNSKQQGTQYTMEIFLPDNAATQQILLDSLTDYRAALLCTNDEVVYVGLNPSSEHRLWYKNATTSKVRRISKYQVSQIIFLENLNAIVYTERDERDNELFKLYSIANDTIATLSDQFSSVRFLSPVQGTNQFQFAAVHETQGAGFYSMTAGGEWQLLSNWWASGNWQWFSDGQSGIQQESKVYASIFVYDLFEKSARDLLPDSHDTQNHFPTFTSDSRQVIFSQNDQLFSISLLSGELTALTPSATPAQQHADVSPDGRLLAFDDGQDIYTIPVQGGTPQKISQAIKVSLQQPTWSPTGDQLACLEGYPANAIVVLSFENNQLSIEKRFAGQFVDIAWAPADVPLFGSTILVQDTGNRVSTLNPETGEIFDAFEFRFDIQSVCWSPHARDIAFTTPLQIFRTPLFTVLNAR